MPLTMAMARANSSSDMRLNHGCSPYYENSLLGGVPSSPVEFSDISSPGTFEFDEGGSSEKTGDINHNFAKKNTHSSSLSSPSSSTYSSGVLYHRPTNFHHDEVHSVINFKAGSNGFMHADGSFLDFEQNYDFSNSDQNQLKVYLSNAMKGNNDGEDGPFGWLKPIPTESSCQEIRTEEQRLLKRSHTGGEEMQALKKQCTSAKKPKPRSIQSSKDPQSIAAKNRREKISERLKILQDLVPNGSKVDMVTMLEKAINYVKFLQLQVKVLATDELWPVHGGKAPELSQVKDAIDAILSSQRDRNSSSK